MSKFSFSPTDMINLTMDAKHAIVDALLAAVAADGKTSPAESTQFDVQLSLIPFGLGKDDLKKVVTASQAKLNAAMVTRNLEVLKSHIKRIAERLPNANLKEKTMAAMCRLALSDKQVNQDEQNVLNVFQVAFGIDNAKALQIAAEVRPK